MSTKEMQTTLMGASDIHRIAPVSAMTLYRWIKSGDFPKPIKITGRNYWRSDEIDRWLQLRSAQRASA